MRALQAASAAVLVLSIPAVAVAEVDAVVVTANRLSRSLDDTLAAVSVVTREDIERQQARSIDDVLRGMEGISIGNSGGPGRLTSYYVRGADADQLLVLVDGVRIGSASAGTAALQNLPVEQIERVEYVRGPRSSLYGSEAIGGVLQVFTRRGAAAPSLALSAGSFGTRQAEGSVGFGGERAFVNLSASAQSQDGANACTGSSTFFAGCFTEEPDRDGYAYRSLSASAGTQWGVATKLSATFWRAESDVEFDGSFANQSDIVQQVAGLDLRQGVGERWMIALKAGRAWDVSDDALDGVPMSRFRTTRDSATLQADWRFASDQLLSLGVDHGRDRVGGSEDFDVDSRDNTAVFAQYAGALGRLRVEASLRTDDNQQFGTHTTGGVGLAWPLTAGIDLIAQYGTGFKSPTFNELYYPFFGNPMLEPEQSRSTELALQGRAQQLSWRVSAFETRVKDLVGFDSSFMPANLDSARIRGLESRADLHLGPWRASAAFTLLDPVNQSAGAGLGNVLPRRVRAGGHLDIDREFQRFSLGARWVAEGARFDDAANTRRVGGHITLDLRGEYRVSPTWRVQARVANLLDRSYETVAFYPQPRRSAYLTLRYHAAAR